MCFFRSADLVLASITMGDVADALPNFLKDDDDLPNLLIVAIDALVCLNGRHVHVMQRWDDNNKIRKIVIDEPHSIYTEPYHAAFDELQVSVSNQSGSSRSIMVALLIRRTIFWRVWVSMR